MTDMTHTPDGDSTCDRIDELLPDYLEGTLPAAARADVEAHAAHCPRCAALVADLNDVRVAAAALPALSPSRDLWAGISARIEAPVIRLDAEQAGPAARPARGRDGSTGTWSRRWLGAAAAALVAITAGVTHQLTLRAVERPAESAMAGRTIAGAESVATERAAPVDGARLASPPPARETPPATVAAASPAARSPSAAAARGAPAGRARGTTPVLATSRRPAAEETYDREVAALRAILRQRRAALNPATVTVLEQNIAIIDQAIAQSRAALANDPASDFLVQQLDNALEKKLELLRTAALLPTT